MDFLGLKTLDIIRHTEELIRRRGGSYTGFSTDNITQDDPAVFKMLGEGRSFGVFQFESEGMQKTLKDARPTSVEDLIALNALYRPGPMGDIPKFIDSKHGRIPITYPDPSLEGILKETYGVIVYQEQVMQVAQIIAGYSLGQADLLRRAMGKKQMEVMVKEKEKFIAGAVGRGYRAEDADRIFEILIPFAGYGFNKSHSAAYAVLAYKTAYLKVNFPAEFLAANMTNEISSTDELPKYIDEGRAMGIPIDPPDINRSGKHFTVVDGRIVYGLLGIKGLGDASAEEIIRCREDGPYTDFVDFLDRVNIKTVGKKVIELLVKTGAFDGFSMSRAVLNFNLERAVDYALAKEEDKKFGQSSLFEDTGEKIYPDFAFEDAEAWDRVEQLKIEKELIGFYFSGHPMDDHKLAWEYYANLDLARIADATDGEYTLVGIIKTLRIITDKNGKEMCFATIADYHGEADLVFFSKTWEKCREAVEIEKPIALKGKLEHSRSKISFMVNSLLDLGKLGRSAEKSRNAGEEPAAKLPPKSQSPEAPRIESPVWEEGLAPEEPDSAIATGVLDSWRELHIRLKEQAANREETLVSLRDYLMENPGPCTVYIHVPVSGGEAVIRSATRIGAPADPRYVHTLHNREGVAEAWGA
jgi:DNA polymerase-3 subunit alpha